MAYLDLPGKSRSRRIQPQRPGNMMNTNLVVIYQNLWHWFETRICGEFSKSADIGIPFSWFATEVSLQQFSLHRWHAMCINPLTPGHFYEFRKFIKISPVGITKWNHFIQEESHISLQKHNFWAWSPRWYEKMAKVTKWWPNTVTRSKKNDFIWSKTTGFRRKYWANSVKQSNCLEHRRSTVRITVSIYCQTRELQSCKSGSSGSKG
jgi:hypothetical protein